MARVIARHEAIQKNSLKTSKRLTVSAVSLFFISFTNFPTFAPVKPLEQIISPIAAELAQFEAFFEKALHADTEPMNGIMQYVRNSQGKRLRPILVLLSAKLLGEVNEKTLRAATFVEMVHSATLIHDDVVDDADLRRNKASVKAQFGNLSAVLAGDYLLAQAMLLMANDADILKEMLRTTSAMSEGELMQNAVGLSYHGSRIDNQNQNGCHNVTALQRQYLDIISRKTAMLMRSCCVAGALSVNASPLQVQQMADFGLNFGILFQLRDDILDGENVELAKALLPECLEKTKHSLENLPHSDALEALFELTTFCSEREG